ncbi:protein kinase [bacterium]|nr:protein kinase [bacterium]
MNIESGHDGRLSLVRFPEHISDDPELRVSYRELSLKLCDLTHPHIVQVHELVDENYLLVEDLQEAQPLSLPPENPEVLLRGLLDALEYAHWRGIPHRLLNCHCLWLFPGNSIKVWGFGLDYLEVRHGPGQMFEVPATAPYWSPEHCLHEEPDIRSDIWSVGVILYRWYAGSLPFQCNCMPVLVDRIRNYHPPVPPGPHADLILRCLEKNPGDRFQNIRELRRYL